MFHPKKKKTFSQTRVNAMVFNWDVTAKRKVGKNYQLIISTMVYTVDGVNVLLARELMAYNGSVELAEEG